MEGKIQVNSGDVSIIAIKVDGTVTDTIPEKGQGKYFESAECTNGAIGSWDRTNWQFLLNTTQKTKCTLNFATIKSTTGEQSGENKMEDLLQQQENQVSGVTIAYDSNNIRYIGKNPSNYVTFNGETWRIIGLMDGIQTSTGKTERLLKIIRKDSLGDYSWDSSSTSVNYGYGVNEWSEADIQKVLNENYFKKTSGGTCYGSSDNSTKNCPTWTTVGLDITAQNMVEEVTWNTGTANTTNYYSQNYTPQQYMWERSSYNGKQCSSSSSHCNDNVVRTTTWVGKVGLMYPSDYGYATDGGGDLAKRGQCLYTPLYRWDNSSYSNCKNNDWLYVSNKYQWTMTPGPADANSVFCVGQVGLAYTYYASDAQVIRPVVYLKSSVKITGGTGEESSPYQLKLG